MGKELGLKDTATAEMADEVNGNTALHIAAQNGHYELVRFLVNDLNCFLDTQNKVGNTALHMSVEYEYNPITMMKTVQDNVESLEEVFRVLEGCAKGDLKKEELVRIGMTKKKELRAWKDGGFQARFMSTAAKL